MGADAVEHLRRGEELRVPADDLLVAVVGVEDEVADDREEPLGSEGALDEGVERPDSVGDPVGIVRLVPGVEVGVRGEHGAEPVVRPVAYRGDAAVLEEARDVAGVADANLPPRVVDGRPLLDGGLELQDGERDAVDEAQQVGPARRLVGDAVLVHHEQVVGGHVVEVHVLDVRRGEARVLAREVDSLVDEPERPSVAVVEGRGGDVLQLVDQGAHLAVRKLEVAVPPAEAVGEDVLHEHVLVAAVQGLAVGVAPPLLLEEPDDGALELLLGELAPDELTVLVHGGS